MFKKQETPANVVPTPERPERSSTPLRSERTESPVTANKLDSSIQASIGPSININGDITGNENLIIHGQISGSISLPDHIVTIGKKGHVDADVKAKSVDVEGEVSGTIKADEMVRVKPSGRVNGDISAPRVALEDGCQFRGTIEMLVEQNMTANNKKANASSIQTNNTSSMASISKN